MLNFFGLCTNFLHPKIKPGQISIQTYHAQKKVNPTEQSHTKCPQMKKITSIKDIIVEDDYRIPVRIVPHDPTVMMANYDTAFFAKTVQKSQFEELNDELISNHKQFTDKEFPPQNISLGNDPKMYKAVKKWIRLTELYKQPVFFADDVDPQDIIQGYFYGSGNCYFMSALANLARTPSRIKHIFGTTQISKQGIYYAKLFFKGVYKQVIVDDFIPVSASSVPLFARPPQGSSEVWVQILQKCYAKLFGSYKNMNGGLPSEAYYALTGAPTFFYQIKKLQDEQRNWNTVVDAYNKNYCIDFGTPVDVDKQKWLKQNHAYTVIGIYQIQNYRLVKLRNPMGRLEWVGRASDFDLQFWNNISVQNKQLFGFESKNNGIFFMLWEDISTYFILFEICEFKDNANLLSVRNTFTMKRANYFQLKVYSAGQVVISLVQDSPRGTGVDLKKYKYSKSYIIVSRVQQNSKGQKSYEMMRMFARNDFAAHHQRLQLEAGTYIVYGKYQWIDKVDKRASCIAYSDTGIGLMQIQQSQHPQLLQKSLMSKANQDPQFNQPSQDYAYVKQFYPGAGDYGFFAYKIRLNAHIRLEIEINEDQFTKQELVLKRPYKNMGVSKIILKPGQDLIIVFRSKKRIVPLNLQVPQPKLTLLN